MDMCGVCVVSEGQLDLSGVSGTSVSGSPGQGALATATGTLRQGSALVRIPLHLESGSSRVQPQQHPDWPWTLP